MLQCTRKSKQKLLSAPTVRVTDQRIGKKTTTTTITAPPAEGVAMFGVALVN